VDRLLAIQAQKKLKERLEIRKIKLTKSEHAEAIKRALIDIGMILLLGGFIVFAIIAYATM